MLVGGYLAALHFGLLYGPNYECHQSEYSDCEYRTAGDPALIFLRKAGDLLNYIGPAIAAFAAVAVAVFTYTLWQSTEKLWRASERQRIDIRKGGLASVIAARAALRSARAAEKGAETAEKVLTTLEAPFVHPVELLYEGLTSQAFIYASFRNYGRSPARVGDIRLSVVVSTANDFRSEPLFRLEGEFRTHGVLGEKDISERVIWQPKGLEAFNGGIKAGGMRLNLLVRHEYESLIGVSHSVGTWYVWNTQRGAFEFGMQPGPD